VTSPDLLKSYYAARAPEYDRVYAKPERQSDLREIEHWLPSVFSGASLLEVACGTGYWTQFLAPVTTEILAVDASLETLQIAKTRTPVPTVRFVVGDAYHLPVNRGTFSGGFAGFWLSHVPLLRVGDFLRGFHSALAPGAKVVLVDNRFVAGSNHALTDRDEDGNTYQLRQLDDGSQHRVLKNFPSEDDLRKAVGASASEVRYREWKYYWALEYVVDLP
jgi:ubiquinone/menaquinone biosynthesis C-methylase UbiE